MRGRWSRRALYRRLRGMGEERLDAAFMVLLEPAWCRSLLAKADALAERIDAGEFL